MIDAPLVRYTRVGKIALAYQIAGDGPDVLFSLGWPTQLDLLWEHPAAGRFLRSLASFCRLILYDVRGTGLSDRGPMRLTADHWIEDFNAVLDAAGSTQAALVGGHIAGRVALLFASLRPDRVSSVATVGSHPATFRDEPDYPWGTTQATHAQLLSQLRYPLDSEARGAHLFARVAPSVADNVEARRWWTRMNRAAASPAEQVSALRSFPGLDIRALLASVRVPVLLLHRIGDRMADVNASRYMADRIPNARLVELPGSDHLPFFESPSATLDELQAFLGAGRSVQEPNRHLAAILFTDIVGSTDQAQRLGDQAWHNLLSSHNEVLDRQLRRFDAQYTQSTGDGVLATFDSPIRALRCSSAIREGLLSLAIEIRAGVHAGEIETIGSDIMGIAVHIAQRVQSVAEPGQIVVSSTVKDLSAGSPVRFADLGIHHLKGIPEPWRLFSAAV